VVVNDQLLRRPQGEFHLRGNFDPRVTTLRLLPGQPAAPIRALRGSGIRALIVEAFGVGNLPVRDRAVAEALGGLVAEGVVVVVGSQSPHGRVDLSQYAGGRIAHEFGAIGAADMTLEATAVKLMYLLGTLAHTDAVKRALTEPLAGETTPA
jgi:L-asparaginase